MTLIIDLPDEEIAALAAKARAQGISAEQYARQVLAHDLEAARPVRRRHISEVIRENMRKVPPEIMAAMPKDGASEHDHYIYGLPKRNP
jgi:plasmid stability protein